MEAMAPDEMDQELRAKEQEIREEIRAKEQEVRELREEIRANEQEIEALEQEVRAKGQEIRAKGQEIRAKEQAIRAMEPEIRAKEQEIRAEEQEIHEVEQEIANAPGTRTRELLEAKLKFLRQEIRGIRQEISNRYQQISSIRQEISNRDQQISSIRQEISSLRSVQEAPASAGVLEKALQEFAGLASGVLEKALQEFAGLALGVLEKLLQELAGLRAEMKAEDKSKKSVCLSSVSQYTWGALKREEGLEMVFKEIDPKRSSDTPAFGWDDRQERSQADRYIPHLNKIASGRDWTLIDAANNHPTLLSCYLGDWTFKGTTDVAFVHREAGKNNPRRGLRCIFELKKDFRGGRDKAEIQTVIRLVMANALAKQFSPFAVLTDLVDSWSLYWMDGPTVFWHGFESRASAVGCIEGLLQDSNNNILGTSETLPTYAGPHAEDDDPEFGKKRRMNEPPGMENLNDLVGLIPDEEIESARVQLRFQQVRKLLHTPFFRGVPGVD